MPDLNQTPEQAAAWSLVQAQAEAATQALAALLPPQPLPEPMSAEQTISRRNLLQNLAHACEATAHDAEVGLNSAQRQHLHRIVQRLREWAEPDSRSALAGYLTRAQFARLAQISPNTLVKWHAAGSLVPAYQHPITHYRYYRAEQIAQVRQARQRKQRSK